MRLGQSHTFVKTVNEKRGEYELYIHTGEKKKKHTKENTVHAHKLIWMSELYYGNGIFVFAFTVGHINSFLIAHVFFLGKMFLFFLPSKYHLHEH